MKKLFVSLLLLAVFMQEELIAQNQTTRKAFKVEILGQGQDLVLIPGAACSGKVWENTVEKLKNNYTCHVITLAGYAGVDPIESTPILSQYKSALVKYIREETNDAILMGHSIGGFIGLKIAAEEKDLIKQLIVVDALPFLAGANNPNMTEEMVRSYPVEPMVNQYVNMSDSAFKSMQQQVIGSMLKDRSKREEVVAWSMASDRKTMAYTMNELMRDDLRDDVANIEIPVLVLGAWERSYPFPKEQQMQVYADQYKEIKDLKLLMADDARHFIMFDAPEWYLNQVREFIQ